MKNQPLTVLTLGIAIVLILSIGSLPSVQSSLIRLFDLDSSNSITMRSTVLGENIEKVKVNRVIDGDTIVLEDGRTIRYLEVDTPETKKPNTPVQCFGPEASAYNTNLVQNAVVYITKDKEATDRYGRDLRFVFLQESDTNSIEKSVNALLVHNGYGRARSYKPNNTYEDVFKDIEQKAKAEKKGVWNCPKPFEE